MSLRRTLAFALVLVVFSAPAFAQRGGRGRGGDAQRPSAPPVWRGKAEIKGTITDEAGKGVENAKVTLVHTALNSGFFVMTKKNGQFEAKDMKAGEWHLQVDAQGYAIAKQTLNVVEEKNKNAPVALKLVKDNSNELLGKAEELFKQGNMPGARELYLKVRELHPELAAVNRAIAFTYGRERNHAEALKYLDMALVDMPTDIIMIQLAAGSAIEMNDVPKAMEYVAKIDVNALTDAEPMLNIAAGILRKQKWTEAIGLLDKTIAKFPQVPDAWYYRGLAKLNTKDIPGAKVDLTKYVEVAPPNAGEQLTAAKDILSKMK